VMKMMRLLCLADLELSKQGLLALARAQANGTPNVRPDYYRLRLNDAGGESMNKSKR